TTTTTPPTTTTTTPPTTTTTPPTTTTTPGGGGTCTPAHPGLTPCDLHSAYALPSMGGAGKTVAIVDAYDAPYAQARLAGHRYPEGLNTRTTGNGRSRKVDQNGGTACPTGNKGWAEEISLGLDRVSAVCQNCKILLVEADTNSITNLLAAENPAKNLGAN